jgi:hypothetical protein
MSMQWHKLPAMTALRRLARSLYGGPPVSVCVAMRRQRNIMTAAISNRSFGIPLEINGGQLLFPVIIDVYHHRLCH